MAARFNKEKLKSFILRRKLNSFGLMSLTVMSILVTLICALTGISSKKLDLLVWVTIALIVLCFIQAFKMKRKFRTIHAKSLRRKKKQDDVES